MPLVEAVGWFGSLILVISLTQTRVMRFRVLNLVACVVLVGYNAAVGVWPMVAMNAVLVGINTWVIVGLVRSRHDARTYDAVEMSVDEPFLARLLQRHAADIARFNPVLPADLAADVPGAAERAFVVTTGDELVGVVLSGSGARADEQQVVLDYVLPPFRDFTPGEFVYRPDGPFAQPGIRRVVAPQGTTASEKYLRAVGFRPDGDREVLELT